MADEKERDTAAQADNIVMPELLRVSPSPHIRNPENTRSLMIDVIIALLPAFIWGVFVFGTRALLIAAVTIASCIIFEAAVQKILHRQVTVGDCSAALTGLLISMNMPVSAPLWMGVVGAFFAIVVVKQLFGGIGKNIVNPALAARVFLLSWASEMTTFTSAGSTVASLSVKVNAADIVATATPLASLKNGVLPSNSLIDMFFGNIGGCIGEVSSVLLIIGGVYLLVRKVITWHIPVSFIATVAALTYLFPRSGDSATFMIYEVLSGGLLLGAFFMATDYTTSPVAPAGRIVYGIGCGAITVLIRYFGGYPEGVSFAILIMNLLVWYLDRAFMPKRFGSKSAEKK